MYDKWRDKVWEAWPHLHESGSTKKNLLSMNYDGESIDIISVISIDHFRKTHILNQNKHVSKHFKLPDWLETIVFISLRRHYKR